MTLRIKLYLQTTIAAVSLGLLGISSATVQANQVFQWTDENGVVHFSQQPPADGRQTEELTVATLRPATPVNEPTTLTAQGELVRQQAVTPAEQVRLSAEQMCLQARGNMKILDENNQVSVEENGQKRKLTAEERAQEIDLARAHIEVYCQSLKR